MLKTPVSLAKTPRISPHAMSVTQSMKTTLATFLLLLLGVVFATQIISRQFIELPELYTLERTADQKDVERINLALDSMAYDLAQTALDFGVWDSTYKYVAQPHPWYIQKYFTYYSYYSKGINGFIITRHDGSEVFKRAYDWSDGSMFDEEIFSSKHLINTVLTPLHQLPDDPDIYPQLRGLLQSKKGLVMFAASQILPTSGDGESRGMFMAWRFIDPAFREDFIRRHQTGVTLTPVASIHPTDTSRWHKFQLLLNSSPGTVLPRENGKVHWLINDISGNPALLAEFAVAERHFKAGWFAPSLLLGIGAAAISILLFAYLVSRQFVGPLFAMQQLMTGIVKTGDYKQRVDIQREDEIGALAEDFNRLLRHTHAQEEQLRQQNRELERLSSEDALTQITNRRGFDAALITAWCDAAAEEKPIAVLMIDVDSFKSYNDHYGHPAGDKVLHAVAQCLRDQLHRATDLVGRYGGEEFAVILTQTAANDARRVAERLRHAIEHLQLVHEHQQHSGCVTVSIGGMVVVPTSTINPENLVQAADKQLYKAKQAGRNQVCFSGWEQRST